MLSEVVPDHMVDGFLKRADVAAIRDVRPLHNGSTLVTYLHQHAWTEELQSCKCGAQYPAIENLAVAAENLIRTTRDRSNDGLVQQLYEALVNFRTIHPR